MERTTQAYLVCKKCGGYGEQIPSNPTEEIKLRRALDSTTKTRLACPQCKGVVELLTPGEFYIKRLKRHFFILVDMIAFLVAFYYAIQRDDKSVIILTALFALFYVFYRFKKNKRKNLVWSENGARPELGNNSQGWRDYYLRVKPNPHARTYHHGGPCPFCGENGFGPLDSASFVCIGCDSVFKILSDRTGEFYFCEGREALLEQVRRESLCADGEYDRDFPLKSILISKHKE